MREGANGSDRRVQVLSDTGRGAIRATGRSLACRSKLCDAYLAIHLATGAGGRESNPHRHFAGDRLEQGLVARVGKRDRNRAEPGAGLLGALELIAGKLQDELVLGHGRRRRPT